MNLQEAANDLGDIMDQVRIMLCEHGMHHSCIDAAALLTKVLHRVGKSKAYRLTVNVRLINAAFQRYVEAHGFPQDEATARDCNDAGGATIILGRDAPEIPEGNWPGHLVVIVPYAFGDRHALLDPSITQAEWPEFGITLRPLCLRVGDEFVKGKKEAKFKVNGTLMIYDAYPDDHTYNDDGDCMEKDGIDMAVALVLRRLGR